jgi:ferrochelatase
MITPVPEMVRALYFMADSKIGWHDMTNKQGVILVNLGTPSAATPAGVKAFLQEFLMDKRVVGIPHLIWWPLLHGLVLPLRCKRVAHAYQQIWLEGGSPLLVYSQAQQAALQALLQDQLPIELAMTYGQPSLQGAWLRLKTQGVTQVLLLPLYPQYSSTTTACVSDAWQKVMDKEHHVPSYQLVREHYQQTEYIQALADSIRRSGFTSQPDDLLLFSFHGIPEAYALRGDPYPEQCKATAAAVAQELGLSSAQWQLSFQSRFGKQKWLEPYTDATLRQLPAQGKKRLYVVCPAFSVDCLETLEEIAVEGKETFLQAGGEHYHYIPALNADAGYMQTLATLIRRWQTSVQA